MWMLAYEAARKGWLRERVPGFVTRDAFFGPMSQLGVSFYDESRRLQPLIRRLDVQDFDEEEYEFSDEAEGYVA
jgi:hypothetical protein